MTNRTDNIGFSEIPYPGLRSFTRDEADIFFGRQEQIYQLLDKLEQNRFLAVVGYSGSGKSSLVRAGMIPALEGGIMSSAGSNWNALTMKPGNNPIENLASCLLNSELANDTWQHYPDALASMTALLSRSSNGLIEVLDEFKFDSGSNLLIVVDQFEELFRFYQHHDENASIAFVDLLLRATEQLKYPVFVVLTMRSDFLGDCSLFHGLPEAISQGQFLVPRLTREQCREAIVGPAIAFGGQFEDGLVNRILNDMQIYSDQLPSMQHALMLMWMNREQKSARNSHG